MLKNYLIITLRNIKKNKVYSLLNFFGLAIGILCQLQAAGTKQRSLPALQP